MSSAFLFPQTRARQKLLASFSASSLVAVLAAAAGQTGKPENKMKERETHK